MENVILVDLNDNQTGVMEKLLAHEQGLLHRAFSVFIFNSSGELLLQQRAKDKYHSGLLWTNTCCSHPREGETIQQAALRRLNEEMGISVELKIVHSFIYKAELDNNLTEYEYDHILIGIFDGEPQINSNEVNDWAFRSLQNIQQDIERYPEQYTEWFKLIIKEAEQNNIFPVH